MIFVSSLEPTSLRTTKPSPASRRMSASFSSAESVIVPSETSTCSRRSVCSQPTSASTRPSRIASSVSVPPSTTGMPCARKRSSLGSRLPVASAVPQPSLTMSTLSPATSTSPSTCASDRPRSRTWVRPVARGLPLRGGRSKSPAMEREAGGLLGEVLPDEHDDLGVGARDVALDLRDRDDLRGRQLQAAGDVTRLAGLAAGVLDAGVGLRLVGGVGDRLDVETLLLEAVGDAAGQAGDRRAVEHGDVGLGALRARGDRRVRRGLRRLLRR